MTIVGASGSGKSTLAAQLAAQFDARLVELDAIFHKPDWTPTPTTQFRAEVAAALDTDRWVVAGNYSVVMDLTQGSADTIVWLDMPRWLVTWRVIKRSIHRAAKREELWNGNRERWRNLIKRDPEDNIIVWAWTLPRCAYTALHRVRRRRLLGPRRRPPTPILAASTRLCVVSESRGTRDRLSWSPGLAIGSSRPWPGCRS